MEHTRTRILRVTESVETPTPLDCQFIGASCMLGDGEPAIIYEERWYPGEGEDNPSSHLIVLNYWNINDRGVVPMCISNTASKFVPVEWDTEASRDIASFILTSAARKVGLIDEKKAGTRSSDHPLVGVPCLYRGHFALPFGVFPPLASHSGDERQVESQGSLLFFSLEPQLGNRDDLEMRVRGEALEAKIVASLEFDWPPKAFSRQNTRVNADIRMESGDTKLIPIMRGTRQYRYAYNTVVSFLANLIKETERPTPKAPPEKVGEPAALSA